jgi:hypothetical protein
MLLRGGIPAPDSGAVNGQGFGWTVGAAIGGIFGPVGIGIGGFIGFVLEAGVKAHELNDGIPNEIIGNLTMDQDPWNL